MRVQIHSQAEPPFVHELGFGVAPGFQTFVATQEQRVGVSRLDFRSCCSASQPQALFRLFLFIASVLVAGVRRAPVFSDASDQCIYTPVLARSLFPSGWSFERTLRLVKCACVRPSAAHLSHHRRTL